MCAEGSRKLGEKLRLGDEGASEAGWLKRLGLETAKDWDLTRTGSHVGKWGKAFLGRLLGG